MRVFEILTVTGVPAYDFLFSLMVIPLVIIVPTMLIIKIFVQVRY